MRQQNFFRQEITERNVNFPDTININRAPTDDSVKLLNEFEKKALENIICKISNNDDNKFKFEAYFLNVANFDTFQPSGLLVITTYVNGQKYQRKIKVKADIMKQIRSLNGQYRYCDINYDLQRYIYFQLCLLVTSILLNDNKSLIELMETVSKYGYNQFDYKTLEDTMFQNQ